MNKKAATKSNVDLGNTEFQASRCLWDCFDANFPGQWGLFYSQADMI